MDACFIEAKYLVVIGLYDAKIRLCEQNTKQNLNYFLWLGVFEKYVISQSAISERDGGHAEMILYILSKERGVGKT